VERGVARPASVSTVPEAVKDSNVVLRAPVLTAPTPAPVIGAVRDARVRHAPVGVPTERRAVPTALAPTVPRRVSVPSADSSAVATRALRSATLLEMTPSWNVALNA
jgi:hypothetical protein